MTLYFYWLHTKEAHVQQQHKVKMDLTNKKIIQYSTVENCIQQKKILFKILLIHFLYLLRLTKTLDLI